MAITPTYSWPLPDDDDLVKDGAEAIRDLGNAIDTTVGGLGGGGLVHINTTTFSAVASQSIGSDAAPLFTSAYKNYRIFFSGKGSSTTAVGLRIRLRANTTDASGTDYTYWQAFRNTSTGATDFNATQTAFVLGLAAAASRTHCVIDISYPQVADFTTITAQTLGRGSVSNEFSSIGGYHNLANSYNGITIFPLSGDITGEVSIYGYDA
jgi:hypothetical protein